MQFRISYMYFHCSVKGKCNKGFCFFLEKGLMPIHVSNLLFGKESSLPFLFWEKGNRNYGFLSRLVEKGIYFPFGFFFLEKGERNHVSP